MTRAERQRLKGHQEQARRLAVALLLELQKLCQLDRAAGQALIAQIVRDYRSLPREKAP